jgi:hypothetical protein
VVSPPEVGERFTAFAVDAEPRRRYALVAARGQQDGLDATAEAEPQPGVPAAAAFVPYLAGDCGGDHGRQCFRTAQAVLRAVCR